MFNGSIAREGSKFHFLYRATSSLQNYHGLDIKLSSIGHATSSDRIHFENRRPFIVPEYEWEKFGCEDPRVTRLNDKYFIFYTALSDYPPTPSGIKVGVAITEDFSQGVEKHQVTHFNSKAMALFPEKVAGKIAAVLTVNTDKPPAKIALALFDHEEEIWSKEHWSNWLLSLDKYVIPLLKQESDHVEVGAAPVRIEQGWLLIYCYIENYFSSRPTFGIEAVLLDLENPLEILGRTAEPLLIPEKKYELHGDVPNVIFPSGALVQDKELWIYYGAADTTCCLAKVRVKDVLQGMTLKKQVKFSPSKVKSVKLERHKENPIIQPNPEHSWESKYTFNPAAIYENGKVHIIYRAMGDEDTSVFGYASSQDGVHLEERLAEPIYLPREDFEKITGPKGDSGCEDPRITKIDGKFYVCYTAFDEKNLPRVALTSIEVDDFLNHRWNWERPFLISPPEVADKNTCILSEKIKGKYVLLHRLDPCIWIDFVDDLRFENERWLSGKILLDPRTNKWDSRKIGIGPPPVKTQDGWLLIYHGLSKKDNKYRLGAVLLDLKNPSKVIARLNRPILEPEADYEKEGLRPGTVFACGAVVIKGRLFVYYGASDHVVAVASVSLNEIMVQLKRRLTPNF